MAGWSEGEIVVRETTIHYYRMGHTGKPPVVLLHGFTDAGLCWLRLASDLAPDYDLIMIDAVGHGLSGGPEHGFRERAPGDVLAVIAALDLDCPALVGHSMGAATAAGVAAEASERLRGIVLEDPGWRDTAPAPTEVGATGVAMGSRAPLGGPEWVAWITAFQAMGQEERHTQAAAERPEWADADRLPWADAKAQFNLAVIAARGPIGIPPWRDTVRRMACPALLITADPERGAIVTPTIAREASGLWQTGEIVHLPGAGHNIRREQYAPYREAVSGFLRRVLV